MEEVVTREVAYQLFPESFPKRGGTVSNIKSYETEMIVDIDEARKEMKKNETASGVFGLLMLATMITPIITTIVLIKRKIKVQETIDILNADIDNLDEVELRDLADKYE